MSWPRICLLFAWPASLAAANCEWNKIPIWNFPAQLSVVREDPGAGREDSVRRHAWTLFGELVKNIDERCQEPRWRTWIPLEVALNPAIAKASDWRGQVFGRPPGQIDPNDQREKEVSHVALNEIAANHAAKLTKARFVQWQNSGPKSIPPFPDGSAAIKTIWRMVPPKGYVNLGLWRRDPAVLAKAVNGQLPEEKWGACVAVNHPQTSDVLRKCALGGVLVKNAKGLLPSKDFYSVAITPQNIKFFGTLNPPGKVGGIAILVGMHLAVRQQGRWLWSTYWWTFWEWRKNLPPPDLGLDYLPTRPPWGDVRWRRIWSHFDMEAFLKRKESDTGPFPPIFNPYLEAQQPGGVKSNCAGCHDGAGYPREQPQVRTDHVWAVPRAREDEK